MSGKTVKLRGWQPQQPPPTDEAGDMRQIVVETVFALHQESNLPLRRFACDLQQIYTRSQTKVRKLRDRGLWSWNYRGKRTWDRRVNEAASKRHGAKIVAVSSGLYRPNPALWYMKEK